MSNKGLSPVDLRDFYIIRTLSMRRIQCSNTWPWASPRSLDFRLYIRQAEIRRIVGAISHMDIETEIACMPQLFYRLGFRWVFRCRSLRFGDTVSQTLLKLKTFAKIHRASFQIILTYVTKNPSPRLVRLDRPSWTPLTLWPKELRKTSYIYILIYISTRCINKYSGAFRNMQKT